VTAPVLDAPGDDEQLTTLRPALVVRNGSSSAAGTRTYEFQISTSSSFSPIAATRSGIAENASGKTSYYWRARAAQGTGSSEWTADGRSRTKPVGYNNARELYDPLVGGETVGTIVGATTWVPGKGLKLNSSTSYVLYALPATVSSGEFSMEIEGRPKTSLPGYGPYAPTPQFVYLGANEAAMGGEDGTFPGVTIRNVWLSDKPPPASLGSAIRDR
jgi:hypothetical protein